MSLSHPLAPDVLSRTTLALVPLNLDEYPTPQDPVQRLVSIDVKSGVEKLLATLDPPPDSILAGRISLHPDGYRLAVSSFRHRGRIYSGPDGRLLESWPRNGVGGYVKRRRVNCTRLPRSGADDNQAFVRDTGVERRSGLWTKYA